MKGFILVAMFAALSVGIANAGVIDITLHSTMDSDIDLSDVLGQWITPGTNGTDFGAPGSGSDLFGALDLVNNLGIQISSIEIYAYGTVGTLNTLDTGCADGSGYSSWTCSAPSDQAKGNVIPESSPIEWVFTSDTTADNIALMTEFKLVDTTSNGGSDLRWEIEVNGAGPTSAAPEPASMIPVGAGLLAMGLLAYKRKSAVAASSN